MGDEVRKKQGSGVFFWTFKLKIGWSEKLILSEFVVWLSDFSFFHFTPEIRMLEILNRNTTLLGTPPYSVQWPFFFAASVLQSGMPTPEELLSRNSAVAIPIAHHYSA
jgi:hypothetical protein